MSVSEVRTPVAVAAGSPVVVVDDVVVFGVLLLVEFALDVLSVSTGRWVIYDLYEQDVGMCSVYKSPSTVSTSHCVRVETLWV